MRGKEFIKSLTAAMTLAFSSINLLIICKNIPGFNNSAVDKECEGSAGKNVKIDVATKRQDEQHKGQHLQATADHVTFRRLR